MAIHVEVNTTTASTNVGELADQLDRLATAADKFNDTKLGSGLAQEFASLRSTMNELRDAMSGANSVFVDMRKQASANSNANKMLESSLKGVRGAIEAQTASLKVQGAVLRATVKEQESLTKSQREAQSYLERQKTTQQKVSEELRKFTQIAKENNIEGREHARIVELITQSHKGSGLEIEKVGQKLKAQAAAWGKSNEELLKATSGWDQQSEKTQKALLYQQRTVDTQKVLNKYLITETTELQKHKDAYELLVKARQNGFLKGRKNAELYKSLRDNILSAIEKETQAEQELASARKATAAIKPPSAHGWGQDPAKLREAAQASSDWLNSLREQAGVIPRVNSQVAALASHMKNLTADQQAEARSLINLTTIQSQFSKYVGETTLGLSKYEKEILKSENALRELEAAKKAGVFDGREQMYLEIQKNITTEIDRQRQAQEGLNNAKNKTQQRVASQDEYARAVENLNKLRDSMYIIPKVATETEAYRKKVAALNAEQQKEHATLTQLQADMKAIAPLYQRSISPIEKYRNVVEAATRANAQYIATNGKMGISAGTLATVTSKARLEFARTQAASAGLNRGIFSLMGGFNALNQVTAASRAAMIGAGQSFGIFEGRTIAVAAAVYTMARAIKSSIGSGSEFEYMTDSVSVLTLSLDDLAAWDGGGKDAARTMMQGLRRETSFLREEMIQLAQDTQFSSQEVAEAATILARSGQDTFEIYTNLSPVLDLAAIAMTDMANAADIATGLMASFNDGTTTLEQAVDVLAVTSIKSKATIDDLGLSIQYIGPLAAQAGMSIEETAAVLGVLADVNIRGSKAGTALRRMLINLQAPGEKAKKALTGLGIDHENLELGERGLQKVFEQLSRQKVTMEQLRSIFGVYAISAATALTQLSGNVGKFNDELDKAAGSAAKMRDLLRVGLKMEFEELASTIEAVQVTAFELFGGEITSQIARLSQHIEDNRERYAVWISETVAGLAEAVKWIVENIGLLANLARGFVALKVASSVILGVVGYWRLLGISVTGATAAIRGTFLATAMATQGFGALSGALAVTAAAARAVWIALGGIVGFAIIGLTSLMYWLTSTSSAAAEKFIPSLSSAGDVVNQFGDRLHTLPTEKLDRLVTSLERDIALVLPQQLAEVSSEMVELNTQLAKYHQQQKDAESDIDKLNGKLLEQNTFFGRLKNAVLGTNGIIGQYTAANYRLEQATKNVAKAEADRFSKHAEYITLLETIEQKEKQLERARHAAMLSMAKSFRETANAFKLSGDLDQYEFWLELANNITSEVDGINATKIVLNMDYEPTSYEEVEARLNSINAVIKRMGEDSIYTTFLTKTLIAAGFQTREGESVFETLSRHVRDLATHLDTLERPGGDKTDPGIAKAANELKAYFDAYEKAKGPVYAVNRELAEVDRWMGEIASRTPRAAAAMKEAGIDMGDAMAALDFAKSDLSIGFLEATIGGVDSRFKDLRKTLAEVEDQELSLESATQLLWNSLNDPKNAEVTKALGGAAEAFNRLFPLIAKTLDSSEDLAKEWEKLSEEAAAFEVSITGNSDSLEDLVKRYSEIPGVTEDAARSTIALLNAKEMLGDALKKTRDETETLAMAQWSLNELVANGTITTERATKAYNQFWASQPIGKLKAETIQRQAQIDLIGKGAREQAIYSAAVSEFGANWMYADQAFKDAAGSLYDVNYEMERSTELHDSYMEFGDGVIGIFADIASGMETSFSNAADSLRDLMKKLLRDLIFMALRNKIMVGLGMEGPDSGSGQSSVWGWAQNMMSFFGGGKNAPSGGGSTTGGNLFNGTGMWNLNTAQNLTQGNWGEVANSIFSTGSGNAASQAAGSGNSFLSSIFSANNWVKAGKSVWTGLFGSAGTAAGSAALGLGGGAAGMGVMSGMGAGTQIASAASYGAYLGPGSSLTYGAMQGTGYGVAAGAGGTAGSASIWATMGKSLASVPVIGWVIAAVLANVMASKAGYNALGGKLTLPNGKEIIGGGLDDIGDSMGGLGAFSPALRMGGVAAQFANRVLSSLGLSDRMASIISGGALMTKLFGRREPRVSQATSALSVGPGGSSAMDIYDIYEKGGWFSSSKRYQVEFEATEEMMKAAQEMFNTLSEVMTQAAGALRSDTAEMIDATLSIVNEFEKDGKTIKATKYLVEMFGRTWEHATQDEAFARLMAEATIAAIDKALGTTAQAIDQGATGPGAGGLLPGLGDMGFRPDLLPIDTLVKTDEAAAAMVGEAHAIAERWRENAELLADGAAFLLAAATDMRNGFNLLNDGTLTQITDLVEDMRLSGEGLADAYARLVSSTKLLEQAFELAGVTSDKTREGFIRFSADVVQAMGGLDEATQKWGAFFDSFYSAGELAQLRNEQLLREGQRIFDGLDLNFGDFLTETGLADFRQLYEEALPTLSPSQVAQWVDAGLALAQFSEAMLAIDDVIESNTMNLAREQMTSFERDMSSLADDFQALRDEAEALGATTEQLAILDGQYAEARQRMADQFREEINTILSDNSFALQRESMTEYQLAVHDLTTRFDEMRDKLIDLGATSLDLTILEQQRAESMEMLVAQLRKQLDDFMISNDPTMGFLKLVNDLEAAQKQAVALGASEAQLTRLRKIAELEMARFIADLRRSIVSSIEGLSEYLGLSGQIEGNYESARDMAEDLYELERRRYEMAQKAIENITKYLKDLETGDLAPGDWRSRLGAGRSNFDEMLELARGGDETALNEITRYADTLLKLGKETLGDTQAYSNLYDYVTGSLRDLMADLALISAPPERVTGGDSSASGSVSGSTTGGMSDLEAYWAILELATQIGSLSVATGESVYTLLDEFGIPLLTLTQGMGVSLSNLDMEGLNSLSLLATAFNTNLPEMLNELKINPNRVAELLGINLEEVRLGIMGGFEGLAEYLGVSIPEALNYVGISVAELAPAFGLYIDNLSEGTLTNLGLMADALGILPTDLAELLGVPLADIATSFGYELGLSSEENFKALRTLASSLGMSLFDLGQSIGEDFDVIVGGLNTDLSSVFSELPEGIGPEVKENLEDLLNNVANAADPKEVQNAVGNLLAFTRDNLPGGIATSLATTLADLGLGVVEEHGLTDLYSRLGEVRTATQSVERALSNTINSTLSGGFGSLSSLLTEIRNSLVGEELIEEVPEITGWGGEGEGIARIPTETPGDQYMEAKALEMDQDDGMEALYTRLEESQAQVIELTEKLTEATESLNKLQVDANQRLGKIVGNTRQTAKRTRETKKA